MNSSILQLLKIFILFFLTLQILYSNDTIELTSEEKIFIKQHPTIIFGADYNWPPYDFIDSKGHHTGIAADFLHLISQKSGLQFQVKPDIWDKTLQKIKVGKLEGLTCAVKTKQREDYLLFTKPYLSMPLAIITRIDNKNITDLSSLKNKTVSVNKSSYLYEWLTLNHPEIKIIPAISNKDALEKVVFGQADAYIGNVAVANYIIKHFFLTNLTIVSQLKGMNTNVCIAVTKKEPLLLSIIQKSLDAITPQERDQIINKWYKKSIQEKNLFTQKEKEWIKKHPTIRFVSSPHWAPFEFIDENGNYKGIASSYLKLLSQKTGITFQLIKTQTWEEGLQQAKERKADMFVCAKETADRQKYMNFSKPYLNYSVVMVTKSDKPFLDDISALYGKKVAMIRGFAVTEYLRKNHSQIIPVYVNNISEALQKVAQEDAYAFVSMLPAASYHINKDGFFNLKISGKIDYKLHLAMALRNDWDPTGIAIINKVLTNITEQEKQMIYNKWVAITFEKRVDLTIIWEILAAAFFILLGTLYWNRKLKKEIIERRKIEHELKTQKDQLEKIFLTVPMPILIVERDTGIILFANPYAIETYKFKKEKLIGNNIKTLLVEAHHRENILKATNEEGILINYETLHKTGDGSIIEILLSVIPIEYNGVKANLGVTTDITKLKEIQHKLEIETKKAQSAAKAKSEFLSNMSHEIRTPMNAILGFTEILAKEIQDPGQLSYIKTIQNAGNTLLMLINDILDLSKIEAGKLQIQKNAANITSIIEEIGTIFSITARKKGLDIIVDIQKDLPSGLVIDTVRVRQILLNLVGNAVKFTEQGYIKISAYTENIQEHLSKVDLILSVEDTGRGIPQDQLHSIFEAFEQVKDQDVKQFGGTGLGLSISSKLSNMMGGKLTVSSTEGKGSIFTLKLFNVDISSVAQDVQEQTRQTHKIIFEKSTILVVDDIQNNRELLINSFKETQIDVITANNGKEALEKFKEFHPDLILMDIRMPIMDGYEAAQEIKKTSNVPIIALTASVMQDEYERIKRENFDGYLRKPVLQEELFYMLSQFLPYQKISTEQNKNQKVPFSLSPKAKSQLEHLLCDLKDTIIPLYKKVQKSNSLSDAKFFAKNLRNFIKQYELNSLKDYEKELSSSIDSFNIIKMETLFLDFEKFIDFIKKASK